MVGIFDTAVLNRVVAKLEQPSSFLLDTFFRDVQTEDGSEEIHFDVDDSKPRLAPFVSPMVAGQVVQDLGYTTKSFKPAYIKDKRRFDPRQPVKRAIGEQIAGNLSAEQRRMIQMRRTLRDQLEMLTRREEWMAAQALLTGQVTVSGEGFPTVQVDFGRDPALTVTLAAGSKWTDTGVKPLDDLEDWATLIQDKSGAVARTVVMDPKAWRIFRSDPDVQKLLDSRRGSRSSMELGPQARGQGNDKARLVGDLGDFEVWVYQETYVDEQGVTQKLLPDNTVILGSRSGIEGTRAYGMIMDEKAGYRADRFFAKSWLEEDPAVRWMLLQSAPLVVPYRPNASFRATVA